MKTEVLRVLREEARSWWRHQDLRRSGETEEASRLERLTIRRDVEYLRTALSNPNAYVSCGGGGTILHLGLKTVSLYAPIERFPLACLAVRLGVPMVDLRPVDDLIALANLPRVTMDGAVDPEPWTSSNWIPLTAYLNLVEPLGAQITNDPRIDRAT